MKTIFHYSSDKTVEKSILQYIQQNLRELTEITFEMIDSKIKIDWMILQMDLKLYTIQN